MRSKKAVYNLISNIFLQIIVIVSGLIVPRIIIGNYGSNTNGLIASITQFLTYISLLEAGFGPVVKSVLYKPLAKKDNSEIANILYSSNKFFRRIAVVFIVYIIILAFVYPVWVNHDNSFEFTCTLIVIISIGTFAEYFFGMTYKLFLQANQRGYIISLISIISYILYIAFTAILVKTGMSIHLLKLTTAILFVIRPIVLNTYVKRKYKIDYSAVNKNYRLNQQWDGLAQHIAAVVYTNTDVTLLTFFSTLINVSIYSVYNMITNGLKNALLTISHSLESFLGDMYAKNEKNILIKSFNAYEVLYINLCTIIYSCTFALIVPFVQIYTKNVTDANYTNNLFGFLITLSSFLWVLRIPYHSLTMSVGHFKETKRGAWIEAFSNLILSIILVMFFDIIGAVIATVIAASIRTLEFIIHSNKKILGTNVYKSCLKIMISFIQIALILIIYKYLEFNSNLSYLLWVENALLCFIISIVIIVLFDIIVYKNEIKDFYYLIKKKRRK